MSKNPPAQYPDNALTRMFTHSSGDLPSTRSAAVGRPSTPAPLTPEERAELDRKAAELGIGYGAAPEMSPRPAPVAEPQPPAQPAPRTMALPDFTNVRYIDLQRKMVAVGNMEFVVPDNDVYSFKKYAANLAYTAFQQRILDAMNALDGEAAADEPDEEVQPVQEDEGSNGVQ